MIGGSDKSSLRADDWKRTRSEKAREGAVDKQTAERMPEGI